MVRKAVGAVIRLRRWILRHLPPKTTPTPPQTGKLTYPEGYEIEELGSFARPKPIASSDGAEGSRNS